MTTAARPPYTVFVIDDSPPVVDIICRYLIAAGDFECEGFVTPSSLLADFAPGRVDCVVADLKMPDIDGGQLLDTLNKHDPFLQFVIVTGHADVPTTVRLMQQGASTLLQKPFTSESIVGAVQRAAQTTRESRDRCASLVEASKRLESLSDDERDVLDCVMEGTPNKAIARQLTLSSRTLDRRRASLLAKMKVETVIELVALVTRIESELPIIRQQFDPASGKKATT